MSSALNPGAVTITLRDWLLTVCHAVDSGSDVSIGRPDKIKIDKPTVNLFLYQIEKNPGYAGADLATRRPDGTLAKKPLTAINLSYLVSFAASTEVAANNLMGAVVLAVHAHPGLNRDQITASIAGESALTGATLDQQKELVRLSMPPISLDELSKLWGMFSGSAYWLSIHLLVTTVILESDIDPEAALPVRRFTPSTVPSLGPSIESIRTKGAAANDPIITGATLEIRGSNLVGPNLKVRLDTGEAIVPTNSATVPGALEAILPGTVLVGQRQLRIETTKDGHTTSSGVVPFILRPKLDTITPKPGKKFELKFTPTIGEKQAASAILSLLTGDFADQHRIDLPASVTPYSKATIDCSALPAGDYIVRLRVDGAESLLVFSDTPPKVTPVVTI